MAPANSNLDGVIARRTNYERLVIGEAKRLLAILETNPTQEMLWENPERADAYESLLFAVSRAETECAPPAPGTTTHISRAITKGRELLIKHDEMMGLIQK